jgi:L-fuculose-phosphate aldolase
MHLAMYQARPKENAIIHVHPIYAIALSTMIPRANLDAIPAYTAAFYLQAGRVPMIDYYPSGSQELHQAVAELAPEYPVVLLRQHGVIVAAEDMEQGLGTIEEIEQCCRIALLTNSEGSPITATQKQAIDQTLGRSWTR